ncbi:MAG TPA: hypothetical protein VF026_13375, partial [Ktedonobacteraceae bacterium]
MNTTNQSYENAFQRACSSTNGDHEETTSCTHPEWMPLDEIAQTWATFGAEATSPVAFQATGGAFLALAFESSAHRQYASSVPHNGSGSCPSFGHRQSVEHAIADLDEAYQQWNSVLLWFNALAHEAGQQEELLASVEQLSCLVLEQQRRVLSLILRVQQEYL